jgi:hypothetical protein
MTDRSKGRLRLDLCVAALVLAAVLGCAPRAAPLGGAPVPARLPGAQLPAYHQQVFFDWEYEDQDFGGRGEGVARIAPPDSARLDFFLSGIGAGGHAWLIGNEVTAPGGNLVRRYVPPAPLMWAALGRLAVPPAADTTARVDGDTLRADIGRGDDRWRVTFVGERLVRLERVSGGRLVELVSHSPSGDVRYENRGAGRRLRLTKVRAERAPEFDASIWRP